MQDMKEEIKVQDFEKEALDELTKEMLIVSGFELSVHHIIDRNAMRFVPLKYSEDNFPVEMLENEDEVKEANQNAFLIAPPPLSPKRWEH